MLDQHRNGMHKQFSQILATFGKSRTPMPEHDASTFVITTRTGTTTREPLYPTLSSPTSVNNTERTIKKEGPEGEETTTTQERDTPQLPTLYHPSKLSSIHINLPFLEAMIHMPKGVKVLKDLLSHKEKLKKAALSVKLGEECSAIIQRSLPQIEGDLGSFTLPCISELKPTRMSIQLADRLVKYSIGVCENLLVEINKFIFPVDFVVLEMDEDELVLIILGRPFLATAHAVIDVHEGKLSLRVGNKIVTFNIGKSMRSKYSRITICTAPITLQNLSENNGWTQLTMTENESKRKKNKTRKKSGRF
ncbi:DNA-directed DNA polymerase, partial [Tanacetum coccineum]